MAITRPRYNHRYFRLLDDFVLIVEEKVLSAQSLKPVFKSFKRLVPKFIIRSYLSSIRSVQLLVCVPFESL